MPMAEIISIVTHQARVDTLTAALLAAESRITYLESDRERFEARAYEAEARMRDAEQRLLNATKDKIVLQKEIAALKAKPKRVKR